MIYFVGMHNKPGMLPLGSRSPSGKQIDLIIKELNCKCVKTNLYDIDYFPNEEDKLELAGKWIFRIQPKRHDIIVLLGAEVHKNYIHTVGKVIKLPHPSPLYMNKEKKANYVKNAVWLIKTENK